jgi:hypothetical protein
LRARVDNEIVVVDAMVDDFITRSEFFSFMQQLEARGELAPQTLFRRLHPVRGQCRLSPIGAAGMHHRASGLR